MQERWCQLLLAVYGTVLQNGFHRIAPAVRAAGLLAAAGAKSTVRIRNADNGSAACPCDAANHNRRVAQVTPG